MIDGDIDALVAEIETGIAAWAWQQQTLDAQRMLDDLSQSVEEYLCGQDVCLLDRPEGRLARVVALLAEYWRRKSGSERGRCSR